MGECPDEWRQSVWRGLLASLSRTVGSPPGAGAGDPGNGAAQTSWVTDDGGTSKPRTTTREGRIPVRERPMAGRLVSRGEGRTRIVYRECVTGRWTLSGGCRAWWSLL